MDAKKTTNRANEATQINTGAQYTKQKHILPLSVNQKSTALILH